eukprot:CAMPEP_0180232784 /NCGR_PEP_ID=MMETSP0987-20121128/27678_1 /TAXON_ID=697907 /ORGANISM="non described non described, Strain CCMP2293" /LENGTH=57 /DNA_ID=CAMNT_0022198461 /DNA_START=533 /DNA_END=703 /DNA_ORIENTATION=+
MNSPSAEESDAVLLLGLPQHSSPVDHEDIAPNAATGVGVDEPLHDVAVGGAARVGDA